MKSKIEYVLEGYYYEQSNDVIKLIENKHLNKLFSKSICKNIKNNKIVFNFVGILSIKNLIVVVLPKYISMDSLKDNKYEENLKLIIPIIKILRQYSKIKGNDEEENFFLPTDLSDEDTSEINIAGYIINDYLQYGIYEKKRKETNLNGQGEIYWDKTVEEIEPLISKYGPVYINTYNLNQSFDMYNYITLLHKWAIKYCIDKYAELLGYAGNLDLEEDINISELGDDKSILLILERELSEVYEDRKINVIKSIIALVNNKYNSNGEDHLDIYGTKTFHVIWEYALGKTLENEYSEKYHKAMDKPQWFFKQNNKYEKVQSSKKTLIPDIVKVLDNKLYIFDAKYYNIAYEKHGDQLKIIGNPNIPGIQDITKQFLYENILLKNLGLQHSYNVFLFPTAQNLEKGYEIIGLIKFDYFDNQYIYNLYIDANKLFNVYLDSQNIFKDIFKYLKNDQVNFL